MVGCPGIVERGPAAGRFGRALSYARRMTDPSEQGSLASATLRVAIGAAIACSLTTALYVGTGIEPSQPIALCVEYVPVMAVLLWLYQDARHRRVGEVFDLGFFLMVFWPVAVPWYCFKSRGRRGWVLLVGLVGLVAAPWATAFAVAWLTGRF
jgi:hypothetical protein